MVRRQDKLVLEATGIDGITTRTLFSGGSKNRFIGQSSWMYLAKSTLARKLILSLFTALFFALASTVAKAEQWQPFVVKQVVIDQISAWNRGDIDQFVSYYRNSPDTISIVDGTTVRGWQSIMDLYKQKYATKDAARGKLELSDVHVFMLGSKFAIVTGNYSLTKSTGKLCGSLSVVCQKTSQGWKIIHDYNSYS
jgi:ketosteroid isomerase-like protein